MEIHPISNGFVPKTARTIIIGTFPPKTEYINNSDFFFYSSVRNHFWNRMENIASGYNLKKTATRLKNVSSRQNKLDKQNFCKDKNIGFVDIFTKIERKIKDSTKDKDLDPKENIVENDILFRILEENKNIDRICCTYKLAYDTLLRNLDKSLLEFKQNEHTANNEEYLLNFSDRKISIVLLFPATRSGQQVDLKDNQYRKLLLQTE